MKNAVYIHKKYDIEELKQMTLNAIIAFDTSALLDLFNYSQKTLREIENLLTQKNIHNRLFIPYHVAEEYYAKQESVMKKSAQKCEEKLGLIVNALNSLSSDIGKSHFLYTWIANSKELIENTIAKLKSTYKELGINFINTAEIIERVFADDSVGKELLEPERFEEEFERRQKYNMPPGSTDKQKERNKSGDYIIWCELIKKAQECKSDIIFITNEKKFDWWEYCDKNKRHPNSKLLIEFNKKTGQRCYFFNFIQFITYLSRNINYKLPVIDMSSEVMEQEIKAKEQQIQDETIAEASNSSQQVI